MTPMCSKPLMQGLCLDKTTRYAVFAAFTRFSSQVDLIGTIAQFSEEDKIGYTWVCQEIKDGDGFPCALKMDKNAFAIPERDLASLLSGVIETKENG